QVVVQRRNVRHALFLGGGLFVSTFMITPLSRVLWDYAPLLSFVQFPWRFLSVQALFTAAITGALLHSWRAAPRDREEPPSSAPQSSLFIVPVFIAVLLLGAAALANLRLDFVPVADADVSAKSLQEYEYFTGNIGTTVNYEYLPVWTQPRPYTSEELLRGTVTARAVQGELASAVRVEKTADSQVWEIDVRSESAAVAVPLLYWPGWRATIDGEAADVRPLPGMGWTILDLPRGIHTVRLQLGSTPVRAAAGAVSLLAAGFVALGLITALPAITARVGQALPSGRSTVIALAGLAILVVALRVVTPRLRTHGPATMDFAQLGWLQRTPVHFENGAVLRGYNYSSDQAARGELFAVKMVWEGEGRPFVLELVGPGENLLRVAATHARVAGATAPEADLLLTLPTDIPPGVYFLRLRMTDGSAALTPTGRPRGDVYLRPLRLDDPGLEAPTAPVATLLPGLDLAALEVQPTDGGSVTVAPVWRAAGPFNARAAIALRLRAPDGRLLAELDTQAGSAVYPTDLWRPGEAVPDPYTLALPAGLPPGEYPLTLRLYDAQTLEAMAEVVAPVTLSAWTPRPVAPPFAVLSDWLTLQSLAAPG
ncbi:MAG: hypothetical protein ACE5FI_18935, partial [Anaerolineales bacterium]